MIRVLIADDHPILRRGLKQIIAEEEDFGVFGEAATGPEALALARRQEWDVVVLDLNMPGRGGIELLRDLKREFPKLPVLILTAHPEDQYAVRVLRAGAAGFLQKESAANVLVTALRKVLRGGKYVSPELAERLAFELEENTERPLHEELSDREFLVMKMIASGKTVSEIAAELALSVKTISTYRSRLLEKMRLKNNAELTYYAVRNGIVE